MVKVYIFIEYLNILGYGLIVLGCISVYLRLKISDLRRLVAIYLKLVLFLSFVISLFCCK